MVHESHSPSVGLLLCERVKAAMFILLFREEALSLSLSACLSASCAWFARFCQMQLIKVNQIVVNGTFTEAKVILLLAAH